MKPGLAIALDQIEEERRQLPAHVVIREGRFGGFYDFQETWPHQCSLAFQLKRNSRAA
jgi:hypothetical protein